jgi:hypothetical protein
MSVLDASYVLPFRRSEYFDIEELTAYLRWLNERCEVIVVDGSERHHFEEHRGLWADFVRHVPPDEDLSFVNGKVNGVTTGVRRASSDIVVVADDDVRYDDAALERIVSLLGDAELVRPQNYFEPIPWHALWDTARTLLNRSISVDYPGTLGLRRSFFMKVEGYDGDVLFENLELICTFEAAGATIASPLDLYVRRIPPTTSGFLSQRVRQAYDELALPLRLSLWLAVIPLTALGLIKKPPGAVAGAVLSTVAIAEVGRRRAGGRRVFPASASLFAPLWILERATCTWLALWSRARLGGVRYGEGILSQAATPKRILRKRYGASNNWGP